MLRIPNLHLAIAAVSMFAASAFALPTFQAIDMGVPTDGTRVMTGYRGYLIRAVSDLGPIASITLGDFSGNQKRIEGGLAQRWIGSGPGSFTTSPGPNSARNLTPSDFNFDSHFIFDPAQITYDPLDPVIGTRQSAPYEDAFYPYGFIQNGDPRFPPNFMPIPTEGMVAYGVAYSSPNIFDQGLLEANVTIKPEYRATTFDVAYVVTNGDVLVAGGIRVDGSTVVDTAGVFISAPEPAALLCLTSIFVPLLFRTRGSSCPSANASLD